MAMTCNLKPVTSVADCMEDFAGTASKFFIFKADANNINAVEYSDEANEMTLLDAEGETVSSVAAYQVNIKAQTGQVTSQSNPDAGGFTNTFTGRVAKNTDAWSYNARIMNNSSGWGILVPTGLKDEYFVIFDTAFDCTFESAYDSGTTPDSDHGSTFTIACSPMRYEKCKVKNLTVTAGA